MNWKNVFSIVIGGAMLGMVLGGMFGLCAGKLAPEFFRHIIPWNDVEPVGFAVFGGATVGVLLGGGLGCFAALLQFISQARKRPE